MAVGDIHTEFNPAGAMIIKEGLYGGTTFMTFNQEQLEQLAEQFPLLLEAVANQNLGFVSEPSKSIG